MDKFKLHSYMTKYKFYDQLKYTQNRAIANACSGQCCSNFLIVIHRKLYTIREGNAA